NKIAVQIELQMAPAPGVRLAQGSPFHKSQTPPRSNASAAGSIKDSCHPVDAPSEFARTECSPTLPEGVTLLRFDPAQAFSRNAVDCAGKRMRGV
ncbi:MAG: hypothetical protein KDA58_00845, partial [Planctomycetaceae bacterium]|nr:hypothetical protein [Planctomycetaceae bacterium]